MGYTENNLKEAIMIRMLKILSLTVLLLVSSPLTFADDDTHGGDEFRKTAMEYDEKSEIFRTKGKMDIAKAYDRLAAIKRHAGTLADQGRWDDIDWSEYHQINASIESKMHGK